MPPNGNGFMLRNQQVVAAETAKYNIWYAAKDKGIIRNILYQRPNSYSSSADSSRLLPGGLP
jgi:hypothetical protein